MKTKRSTGLIWSILFWVILIILIYPVLFSVGTSFKSMSEMFTNVISFIPLEPTTANYTSLFERLPILRITMNTFTIATSVTILKLLTSFLAAYSFVYFRVKHHKRIYFLFIATIFIPFTVTMIPNFIMLSKIGFNDRIWGVILPQIADATGILLLNQAMRTIPSSLIEVAQLDDIGHRHIMTDIVLPIVRPQITSSGIWFFVSSWNEFVWPNLMLKSTERYTLPLALQMFISAEAGTDLAVSMAVAVITMIVPLSLYLIFQKQIIGTFTSSGIK